MGNLNELVAVIDGAGELVLGGEDAATVAQWWQDAGLSAEQARDYIDAGCWDADRVALLVGAGITADHLRDADILRAVAEKRAWKAEHRGRDVARGDDLNIAEWVTDASLGYAYSNGDLSAEEILHAMLEAKGASR